jgi:hypothetical protein
MVESQSYEIWMRTSVVHVSVNIRRVNSVCEFCVSVNHLHLPVQIFYTYTYRVVMYIYIFTLTQGQCKYLSNTLHGPM